MTANTEDVNLLDKIFEFLYATPEEVQKKEAELEETLRRRRLTVIEGGKK